MLGFLGVEQLGLYLFIHSSVGRYCTCFICSVLLIGRCALLFFRDHPLLVGGCVGWLVWGGGVGFILLAFCEGLLLFLGAYCMVFWVAGFVGLVCVVFRWGASGHAFQGVYGCFYVFGIIGWVVCV